MVIIKFLALSSCVFSFICCVPLFVHAEDAAVLDEVQILAYKNPQKLEDTPVSISAISGDKLADSGILDAQDLVGYTPNFTMTQTGVGTLLSIRGMSSDVNQGYEQSVGLFVDGIHLGRPRLARAPFLDVERIEVLRGSQGVLLGKNTTAGAINVINARPSQVYEGNLTALYEPEYGEKDIRLMVSGPLNDTLTGRVAVMDKTYDGFIKNTTLNRLEAAEDAELARVTLQWKPTDAWDFTLKLEDGSFNDVGRNVEVVNPVSNTPNNPNPYATAVSFLTAGTYHLDTTEDGQSQSNGDFTTTDTQNITLNVEHRLGDFRFTSATAYIAYDADSLCDCDLTGMPNMNLGLEEGYQRFSQEFHIASAENQTLRWLAGGLYQSSSFDVSYKASVPSNSMVIGKVISPWLLGAASHRDFTQHGDLYAVFAQGTWNISKASRLIVGGRYTQEDKDANRHLYHLTPRGEVLPLGTPEDLYNQLWSIVRIDPHNKISGQRKEADFTPNIVLQHNLNTTDMLYVSYTTGVKSGGFDAISNAIPNTLGGVIPALEGTWEFKPEHVKTSELGGKFAFANNRIETNIALFRSVLRDMQASQTDNGLSANVTNVGTAVAQGVELDGRWAITPTLIMRGGAAYLDFNYTHFPDGQCYFGQADNLNPVGDGICDITGKTREFAPNVQGNLGWDYSRSLLNNLQLTTTLDVLYSASYLTTQTLDPRMKQPAYTKLNGRIALAGSHNRWALALIGKNLTDRRIVTYAGNLPLAGTFTQGTGSGYYAYYEPPRSIALQGSIRF